MKKKDLTKKLVWKKDVIASLNKGDMHKLQGGKPNTWICTEDPNGCSHWDNCTRYCPTVVLCESEKCPLP